MNSKSLQLCLRLYEQEKCDAVFLSTGTNLKERFTTKLKQRGVKLYLNQGDYSRGASGWLVDLFALKKCWWVIGTDYSTFSWIGSWMAGHDLIPFYPVKRSSINCVGI